MSNSTKYLSYEGLSYFKNIIEGRYEKKGHTHSYLPLAGGTMTGTINSQSIIPTTNNTYNLGSSSLKYKNVYATTFTGALSGNASSASLININNSATSGDFPLTFVSSTNTGNQGLYVSTGKSLTFNPSSGNLKATTLYENGTSLVNKYAQISDCFIIKRDGTDNLTAAQITSYADLSTSSTGQSAFKLLKSGSYNVARSGSSELLINLGTNTGSASALEFLTNYTHTSRLKVRKIIDSNRVSGEFKELAWYSDIPTIPTSLPANGGNADTVDNKHASDFVLKAGDTMTGSLTTNNFLKITAPASDGTPTRNAAIIRSEFVSSDANKAIVHIGSNYGYISVNENNTAKPSAHVDAIGIYRGVIGVGGTFTYDTLKSNQSNNISLEAVGKVKALSFIENGQSLSDKYQPKGNYLTSQDHYKNSVTNTNGTAQSPVNGGTFTIPNISVNANGHVTNLGTTTVTLPADTNTWRPVQCNGTSIGENTLNLKSGSNVTLSRSGGTITINATMPSIDSGEMNVQSNWNETNTSSDAYIQNKPTKLSQFTDDVVAGKYLPLNGGTVTGDVTANSITAPKIVVKGSNHSATMEMNASSLKIDKELMLTAGGTADICPDIACALKADRLQVKNLISENIILGSSNNGAQSNMSFNVQKYGSISNTAPASLTTLLTVNTTGNVGIGTTSPSEKLEVNGKVKALSFIENGQPLSDKYQLKGNFAAASHGNHVPATQTASNKVFLRNDNTWQTITPANIGAAETVHNHDTLTPNDIDDMFEQDFGIIFQ